MNEQNSTTTMSALVTRLLRESTDLWWDSDSDDMSLGPKYTRRQQQAREAELERFLGTVTAEVERPPQDTDERRAVQDRVLAAFGAFAQAGLGWERRHVDLLLGGGYVLAGSAFGQRARHFDPEVSGSDIFQASRNMWTMCGLQTLMGLPVRVTRSVFAYSMLYPYSDNYLDDPTVPASTKMAFNERFTQRLRGEELAPENVHEQHIGDLVGMIEDEYDRGANPQVFDALLAIHRAQCKSLRLMRRQASPYEVDILGISIEKGGCSVLADGYLVAGSLTEAQAACLFGYGVFLQFADDLQDVEDDRRDGLMTVFSQTVGHWPLDALTARTLRFGQAAVQRLSCFDAVEIQPLVELMRSSAVQLVVGAIGRSNKRFTRRYLGAMEPLSPFRFSFLRRVRKRLARQRISLMRLVEAMATPEGAQGTGSVDF